MAKKSKNFKQIYAAVLQDAKRAAIAAAKETAKQISRDMHREALNALKYYYNDYDPDYYWRTYNLRDNSLSKIYQDNTTDSTVDIIIGEKFSVERMNTYKDGAKPEWILSDFLAGVHFNTNYNQSAERTAENMMDKFINEKAEKLIEKYMNSALLREFTRRMR